VVTFPSDWRHAHGVDLVTAFPPDVGARFRWHERVTPQPTFSGVLARVLASDPDFRALGVEQTLRVVTHEGEYAAWVAVTGRRQGRPAERTIGAVFLDQFAAVLESIAVMPRHFSYLRAGSLELLRRATFGLAARPRPFYYEPAPGWQAIPSGASTTWYPPDFPNNRTSIAIPHAKTNTGTAEAMRQSILADLVAGVAVEGSETTEITTEHQTVGTHDSMFGKRHGEPIARHLITFVVRDRIYVMRLETATPDSLPAMREVLVRMARSFRPLPGDEELRLGRAFVERNSDFDHWAI